MYQKEIENIDTPKKVNEFIARRFFNIRINTLHK